jgi:class 3 adenylate cyclase/predicted ATPase
MDIGAWLRGLGLEQYEPAFRDNAIDAEALITLTADDLRELGVAAMGHRKKFLAAIAALGASAPAPAPHGEPIDVAVQARPALVALSGGERRHLTVMFCDLVGSTEISGRLDAEDWRDIVSHYHRAVAEAVARFGGHVAKNLGDGALVYFGYPQAQENDAERALRAGLAIIEAVAAQSRALAERSGPELAVRVGIHAGPVVLGEDAEVFGEVPNIAARVQTAAEPGMLLITRDVHRLVSGLFVANDRGVHTLKGVAEPVGLFQVVRASGAGPRRAAGRVVTPLIGREEELRQIESRWARAHTGRGQLALVVGEAGLGKSRLTEEFQSRLAETPHTWVEWGCSQLLQNTPFHPFIEFARRRLEEQEPTPEGRVVALAAWHRAVGLDAAQSVPLVAPLLELPVPADYAPAPSAPEERRRRLIATLAGWVAGGARTQALLLLVEDVHWADPSTLDLLRVLAEQGAAVPLMLLVTGRPEFRATWPHRSHHTVITLGPLERCEVLRMVGEVAARHAISGETMEALVARTGGVPLFIEEVTRLLLEGDGRGGAQHIPSTLQASLTARLDRLGPFKMVAQIAAVLGREFTYPLLRVVSGSGEAALGAALERLADADLIHAQGMPPDSTYRFKHALVQDAAYESLLKSRRRALHRAVALALTDEFKEVAEVQPELLAHHLTEAGENEAAVAAWQRAGERALHRAAYIEASKHFGKAIQLAEGLGDGPAERLLRLRLQIACGQALLPSRGWSAPETTAAFARAAELAAGVEDAAELFSARYGLWAGSFVRGEPEAMRTLSAAFLRDIECEPDLPELIVGHRIVGASRWYEGDYIGAREHLEQALTSYDPELHRPLAFRFGQDVGVSSMVWLAMTLWPLGEVARARRFAKKALADARHTEHLATVAYALSIICVLELLCRDTGRLLLHAESLLGMSREHGLASYLAYGTSLLGYARWRAGEQEAGETGMRAGIGMCREQGIILHLPLLEIAHAEAEAEMGRVESALAMIDEAVALSERTGQHCYDAELHRVRGNILLRGDQRDLAGTEAAFARSIEIARGQRTRSFELRAALALAKLFHATQRDEAARTLLGPALEGFSPTQEFPEIEQAQSLLAALHS